MDEIQSEIQVIEKSIVKLFNERKINEILNYFKTDFVGFSSTKHERVTSLAQLKKTFLHYLHDGDQVTYSIRNLKIKIYGEAALSTFNWKVDIKKNKKLKTINGRGSHIFLISSKGWRIVHEHYSRAH